MQLSYQYLMIVIPSIWLLIASLQDIKKREVANWLSASLLSFGICINILFSIINNIYSNLIPLIIVFTTFAIISLILYYGRVFGGGDAKLLIALSPFLISTPNFFYERLPFSLPISIIFLLNTILIGSIYGLIWSIVLAIKNKKAFFKNLKKILKSKRLISLSLISILISLVFLVFFLLYKNYSFFLVFIILFVLPSLSVFIKSVEKTSMIRAVKTKELTEGDWLAERVVIKNRIIKPSEGLSSEEINLLKKFKKKVLIKYGIPFVPVFLISFFISLFFNLIVEFVILFV